MDKPMIEIKNCNAAYEQEKVLHHVSISIMERELVVLIGPSGCGKTTLLKLINGLVVPDKGEVMIGGNSLKDCNMIELRKKIGYAVQGAKLFPHLSVEDNICYVPSLERKMTKEEKRELSDEMLALVQLPQELAARFPSQLSGGQQQRIGIARALAFHPPVLLMDEPFGAVDEITRRSLQKELLSLWEKTHVTIVFVTHDIREAIKLGSRIVLMQEGKIIQQGTGEEMIRHPVNAFAADLFEDIR